MMMDVGSEDLICGSNLSLAVETAAAAPAALMQGKELPTKEVVHFPR